MLIYFALVNVLTAVVIGVVGIPIVVTGWLARRAVGSRPARPWLTSTLVVAAMLLLTGVVASRVGSRTFPDVVTAVQ